MFLLGAGAACFCVAPTLRASAWRPLTRLARLARLAQMKAASLLPKWSSLLDIILGEIRFRLNGEFGSSQAADATYSQAIAYNDIYSLLAYKVGKHAYTAWQRCAHAPAFLSSLFLS